MGVIVGRCRGKGSENGYASELVESGREAGTKGGLFPRWQELKRKGGKKRRSVQITEEILKDFSSMCT